MAKQETQETGTDMTLATRARRLTTTLQDHRDAFERALAGRVDPDLMIQIIGTAFLADDRLRQCSTLSIYQAALEAAQVGLRPDGEEAAVVPYWNRDLGSFEAQFQPMYVGLVRLMLRAGARRVEAHVVLQGDEFEYGYGLKPYLLHKPLRGAGADREVEAAYAWILTAHGERQFEVMERDELEKIKQFAAKQRGGKSTPAWRDWEEQMHRKAPLRRLRKWVELDANASAAFRKDAMLEAGEAIPLGELAAEHETRSLTARAAEHVQRQTGELRQAIRTSAGERAPEPPAEEPEPAIAPAPTAEEAAEPEDEGPLLSLEDTVPDGKHRNRTWRWVLENDRKYAEDVVTHGWLLSEEQLRSLQDYLRQTATADRQEGWRESVEELYRRGEAAATALAGRGELTPDEAEDLELLRDDGLVDPLREIVEDLEARADAEPSLPLDGEDG